MCRNYKCKKNDFVVTSHCNANQEHFRWEWKEVGDGVGLMKTKSTDLCLEGDDSWDFILRPCDEDNERQHFQGFDDAPGAKFKLLPKNHQRSNTPQCMTMLVSQKNLGFLGSSLGLASHAVQIIHVLTPASIHFTKLQHHPLAANGK